MPEITVDLCSSLCSLGMRPQLMTGFLVQVLRQHFAARDRIEEPSLRDSLWVATLPGGIVIESAARWRPGVAMARPAIIVRRDGWRVERRGIDDRHMGQIADDGNDYYSTFLCGSHTLFAIASEGAEAEILCAEIYRELIQFGPVLREYLDLHRFVVAEVGQLSSLQEAEGAYAVPITVAYAFEETWVIAQESPVLKRISLEAVIADSP